MRTEEGGWGLGKRYPYFPGPFDGATWEPRSGQQAGRNLLSNIIRPGEERGRRGLRRARGIKVRGGGLKFGMLMFLNSTRGCLVYDGRGLMGNGGSSFCNTKSVTLRHSAKLQGFGRDTCMIWGYRRGRWAVASLVFESLGCWRVVGWGGGGGGALCGGNWKGGLRLAGSRSSW